MRTRAAADFEALVEAYLDELRRCHYSPSTIDQARHRLPHLVAELRRQKVRDIRRVGEAHLVRYVRRLSEKRLPSGRVRAMWTQIAYVQLIKRFFAFLEKRSVILSNPARAIYVPHPERLPGAVLSEGEARRLVAAPSPWTILGQRDRALLEVFYGAGLRLMECVGLDLGDVDLKGGTLLVRNGKGRKDRVVPLPGRAALALTEYLRDSRPNLVRDPREPALFLTRGGRRIGRVWVQKLVPAYAHLAGIDKRVHPHLLRHTCATHLLQGGADVRHVQELLGHQSLNTTVVYTRVNVNDLKKVLDRAHPRERRRRKIRS